MVNYQNSKIYKLWSDQSDMFYIGSTTRSLAQRFWGHEYRNAEGHTNIRIELIEAFPCNSKEELLAREGFYIRQHRPSLINKCVAGSSAGRTSKEYHREYHQTHRDENNEYVKNWRAQNVDYTRAFDRNRWHNSQERRENQKQWEQENRAKRNAQRLALYYAKKEASQ